jgi:hypothetical protein
MGIRSRLKSVVARRLGADPPAPAPVSPPPAPARAAVAPVPKRAAAAPAPKTPAAPKPQSTASPPIDPVMAARAVKHFEKTRKAVLKFVIDQGGQASMGDMHDYSERRYFIAHRKFSDLMEGIVGEGLVDYDEAAGEASITDAGRAYLAD